MKKYLIALGSNLETQNLSRLEVINKAIGYFSQLNIILIKVSSFWESRSYPDKSQPDFINAVSEVHSELNPYQILHALKNVEKKTGSLFSTGSIFLTTGNKELWLFQNSLNYHFLVRTVDDPELVSEWTEATFLKDRGPYTLENEIKLLKKHKISMLVTKNSGGISTYAKIEAARYFKIPVLMVRRPELITAKSCQTVNEAVDWVNLHCSYN